MFCWLFYPSLLYACLCFVTWSTMESDRQSCICPLSVLQGASDAVDFWTDLYCVSLNWEMCLGPHLHLLFSLDLSVQGIKLCWAFQSKPLHFECFRIWFSSFKGKRLHKRSVWHFAKTFQHLEDILCISFSETFVSLFLISFKIILLLFNYRGERGSLGLKVIWFHKRK